MLKKKNTNKTRPHISVHKKREGEPGGKMCGSESSSGIKRKHKTGPLNEEGLFEEAAREHRLSREGIT